MKCSCKQQNKNLKKTTVNEPGGEKKQVIFIHTLYLPIVSKICQTKVLDIYTV